MPPSSKAVKASKTFQYQRSTSGNPVTFPPDNPILPSGAFELARKFLETLKSIHASQSTSGSGDISVYDGTQAEGNFQLQDERVRASKLEHKEVDEIYVHPFYDSFANVPPYSWDGSRYKIVKSAAPEKVADLN
jgi:hypothetical protein